MWFNSASSINVKVIMLNKRFLAMYSLIAISDDCRIIQFEHEAKDKILRNHVLKNISVRKKSQCMSHCFIEPNCVSYNYGPLYSNTPTCELSNRTHLQVSSSDFVRMGDYIYRHILVRDKT